MSVLDRLSNWLNKKDEILASNERALDEHEKAIAAVKQTRNSAVGFINELRESIHTARMRTQSLADFEQAIRNSEDATRHSTRKQSDHS